MIYGACDCKSGNTRCCSADHCLTPTSTTEATFETETATVTTESFQINCGPGTRNRRCAGPPTDRTAPTSTFVTETIAAHNKCHRK